MAGRAVKSSANTWRMPFAPGGGVAGRPWFHVTPPWLKSWSSQRSFLPALFLALMRMVQGPLGKSSAGKVKDDSVSPSMSRASITTAS